MIRKPATLRRSSDRETGRLPETASKPTQSDLPPSSTAEYLVLYVGEADENFSTVQKIMDEQSQLRVKLERIETSKLINRSSLPLHTVVIVADEWIDKHCESTVQIFRNLPTPPPVLALAVSNKTPRAKAKLNAMQSGAADCLCASDLDADLLVHLIEHVVTQSNLRRNVNLLNQRFELAKQGANDGIWEWDLHTNEAHFSPRWIQLLHYSAKDIGSTVEDWFSLVHPRDLNQLKADLAAHLRGKKAVHENEHRIRDKTGAYRWMLSRGVALRDENGQPQRMAGSLSDVSHYRRREQHLRQQSRHDALTDLPRRELFLQHLARAVELAREHDDYAFSVLLVELDRFGMIHDSVGHRSADAVLARLARRLEACVRPDDLVARFGTQQFAILLENLDDPNEGTRIAARIHQSVREPFEVSDQTVYTTVSIGMTSSVRRYAHVEDVITDVITAVGRAKERGHNRHEVFDTQMRIDATALLRLEMALRQAVENHEFVLHYQPIISLSERKLTGFEALIRWNHPRRGLVYPGDFISVAENTGLIIPIGRWALQEAARQLNAWNRDRVEKLTVSVNLSGKQTADPNLLSEIARALADTEIDDGTLKIELTESVLMANAESAAQLLNQLRSLGLRVYIDDFGTGYSSLSYLHRLPVDGLKIDKSFVDVLDGSKQSSTIVRTIMNLAENLGVDVIAEGIEQEVQAEQLQALGCPSAQGYLFSKPLSPEDATTIIETGLEL